MLISEGEEKLLTVFMVVILLCSVFVGLGGACSKYETRERDLIGRELYDNYNQIYDDDVLKGIRDIQELYRTKGPINQGVILRASTGLQAVKIHTEIQEIPRLGYSNNSIEDVQQYIDSSIHQLQRDNEYERAKNQVGRK